MSSADARGADAGDDERTGGAGTLVDMHCHLSFLPSPARAATRLACMHVSALCVTVTPEDYERTARNLAGVPSVRVGVGLHPWWVADGTCGPDAVARAAALAEEARYVGEIGLDYGRGRETSRAAQLGALDAVLEACEGGGHVLSLHSVRAASDVLEALERHHTCLDNVVILHWFTGSGDELARAARMGCRFSMGRPMLGTRRGRSFASQVPAKRLLLETDLPSSPEQGRALGADEIATRLREAGDELDAIRGRGTTQTTCREGARLLEP